MTCIANIYILKWLTLCSQNQMLALHRAHKIKC